MDILRATERQALETTHPFARSTVGTAWTIACARAGSIVGIARVNTSVGTRSVRCEWINRAKPTETSFRRSRALSEGLVRFRVSTAQQPQWIRNGISTSSIHTIPNRAKAPVFLLVGTIGLDVLAVSEAIRRLQPGRRGCNKRRRVDGRHPDASFVDFEKIGHERVEVDVRIRKVVEGQLLPIPADEC